MAEWKKVVVSGSAISQLNNDAGYLIAPNRGFVTASYVYNGGANATFASSITSSLNFASSSGQGLTITMEELGSGQTYQGFGFRFGLSDIPNSSLENSTITVGAGSGLTGGGSTALGATSTLNIGQGNYITVNADDVAVNTTTLIPAISGSIIGTITGEVTVSAQGLATINFGGGGITSAAVNVANDSIMFSDSDDSSKAKQETIVDFIAAVVASDANLTATAGQIALSDNVDIAGDLSVAGDIVVQGTASFQNTENLLVADQFILLNSGSTTTGPGGIVVQQGTQDIGEVLAWYSTDSRWGVSGSFDAASSTFTPDAFVNVVVEGTTNDADTEVITKYTKKGNMFVGNAGDIWIYA